MERPIDDRSDSADCFADSEQWTAFSQSFPSLQLESCRLVAAISKIGESIGDVTLLEVIGEGAFGKVFLGRQTSLDREVAVKITANLGHEGRTMATMNHQFIVQVHSESIDEAKGIRLLCMQFVRGATLQHLIGALGTLPRIDRNGKAVLRIVDQAAKQITAATTDETLDPEKLRNREILSRCQLDEAVCWIGSNLAEALAYAHRQNVLHRDIKPGNIIVNQYGHPMLTDFGLSIRTGGACTIGAAVFGGTLGYMAPEHIRALNPSDSTPEEVVDCRSDIYSLGAVLLDFSTSSKTRKRPSCTLAGEDIDRLIVNQRDTDAILDQLVKADISAPLTDVIRHCLEPNPDDRYQLADHLANDLRGVFSLLKVRSNLAPKSVISKWAKQCPFLFLLILTCVPNFAASGVNLLYNSQVVIKDLNLSQQSAFIWMVVWYNVIVLIVMAVLLDRTLFDAYRRWNRVARLRHATTDEIDDVRKRVLSLPIWTLVLGCVGWLPFSVVIPAGMEVLSGPIPWGVVMQISIAFAVTGLVAIIANYYVVAYVVVGVLYPKVFSQYSRWQQVAEAELFPIQARNRLFQVLAGLTPLAAATCFLLIGPDQFTDASFGRFRMVLFVLIVLGIFGFSLATRATTRLSQIIEILTRPVQE